MVRMLSTATARATAADTAMIIAGVLLPTFATGVVKRRPRLMRLAQRVQADRLAIRIMRRMRRRYGPGPLLLRLPRVSVALPLTAEDVELLLADTDVFTPASAGKRAALRHFQPHGSLISDQPDREPRRRFNESVLEIDHPLHSRHDHIVAVIDDETDHLVASCGDRLGWDAFSRTWWRIVRRIVLGDAARDDDELTDLLGRLRLDANWAFLRPRHHWLHRRFDAAVRQYVERAEPGGLVTTHRGSVDPAEHVPHWLFAFDAAGIVTFRTLALLATHPEQAAQAEADEPPRLPCLRACVMEAVRLWPTTPLLLRQSTQETGWGGEPLPPGTRFVIFTPYFHRDGDTVPHADRFAPGAPAEPGVVPFSDGPARCPGRNLVLLVASTMLARLLRAHTYRLKSPPELSPDCPLPATVDAFGLSFAVAERPFS
jgi:hypothetical protein